MDLSTASQSSGEESSSENMDGLNPRNKFTSQEEYDPSQPLDSSDEESEECCIQFEKTSRIASGTSNSFESQIIIDEPVPVVEFKNNPPSIEPEIDLKSIPMPSDEYRRPTIQFSIPTRHRLMSISSLIKRQKGVMKKQDKGNGSGLCYNLEVSKAFHTDSEGGYPSILSEDGQEDRPKVSLVQEIFGSDDEDIGKENEDEQTHEGPEEEIVLSQVNAHSKVLDIDLPSESIPAFETVPEDLNRWKTIEENLIPLPKIYLPDKDEVVLNSVPFSGDMDDNSMDEIRISIKPPSELLEVQCNEQSSPEVEPIEISSPIDENDNSRGKENKQIILECVSDEEPDFEVTFVGIGRTNLSNLRAKHGQRITRKIKEKTPPPRKKSISPINGFEEGEIVEDRKRKKAKKKKSKKRKRSKDSRVSSKVNSERSTIDSAEKKSLSENSDGKEVSWRKPKMAKSRNYRNGQRESPEKHATERPSRNDDSYKGRRSPGRFSSANERLKTRRERSLSNGRFRSNSRSSSRGSLSRWEARSKGSRQANRSESHRSRSSISNHSSPSLSRSRSLTKKKGKRRHSPSPVKRNRNGRSTSRSPQRPSKSPRLLKRHRANGTEINKRDKVRERSKSPIDTHSSKKSLKLKVDEPNAEESKKKSKKDKPSFEEAEKEKRKKRKRKEKSLSPVKAIVADGDSIKVSLSFQKAEEKVPKPPKVTPAASKHESSSEKSKSNNGNNSDYSDNSERQESSCSKPGLRKGTITINLAASPTERHDSGRRSPDIILLEEKNDKKSQDGKKGDQKGDSNKNSSSGSSQRIEGLDFVSSSHECSAETAQSLFSSSSDPKVAPSPAERSSTSKSPYKFNDYLVSSTCDVSKTSSPAVELSSPRVYNPGKQNDPCGTPKSQKVSDNSPFSGTDATRAGNSSENGTDKRSPSSPESLQSTPNKGSSLSIKPMIGNIPGLFPSGFSSGAGGMGSSAPVVIPAPPRIIPNTSTSSLLNSNVLVSVASALYAPLLAAKQHQNTSVSSGQASSNVLSNLQRHSGSSLFSKSLNSHSQPFGLYNSRTKNGSADQGGDGGDSPFSPNSSDGDDLFEPPGDANNSEGGNMNRKGSDQSHHQSTSGNSSHSPVFGKYQGEGSRNEKQSIFDNLFSSTPKKSSHSKHGKKKSSSHLKKSRQRKGMKDKRTEPEKNGDGTEVTARLNEEVPGSAVALKMKEKFLKKLNRQERVVEEVKLSLKPHYSKKHVTKEEYKDILRKAVPKICHNKSGEINPNKIKELVEAYVKKVRKARKSENNAA